MPLDELRFYLTLFLSRVNGYAGLEGLAGILALGLGDTAVGCAGFKGGQLHVDARPFSRHP
jgi:hypothetical protein